MVSQASEQSHNHPQIVMADALQPSMAGGLLEHAPQAHESHDSGVLDKMIPNLDRQLIYPLLNFLKDSYPEDDIPLDVFKLEYELMKHTNMIDFLGQLKANLDGLDEAPAEFQQKRDAVLAQTEKYQASCGTLLDLLADPNVINNLRSDKVANLNYLKENHEVTPEMVSELYDYGQHQYSCGSYQPAADLLYQFRILVSIMVTSSIGTSDSHNAEHRH